MERMLWPPKESGPYPFLGMNTFGSPHQLPFGQHVLMQNCAVDQVGACSKRYGYEAYGATLGSGPLLGMFELIRNDGSTYLLKVSNLGKLYTHPSTQLPIRLAVPYHVTATNGSSGAVSANLVATTKYQYAFVAVDATGKTLSSYTVDATAGEVTTGATAYPVTVVAYGVYAAVTYEVYRRTFSGSYGAWGRMTTGLTHATASGVTTVTYTDSGATVPDTATQPPASNTTEYTLPTTAQVDWVSVRRNGNNYALLANGAGIVWCDGTAAGLLQPSTTTLGSAVITSNRLFDVTNSVWTTKGLHYHHRHIFATDFTSYPNQFQWSDVDDMGYWHPFSTINTPDPAGGRVLDFVTKDDVLIVGLNTSVYALWGSTFDTSAPGSGIYFSRVSDVGVASERSMVNGPGGTVIYLGVDRQVRVLAAISPVREQVVEGKLCESMSPTIREWSDHANAVGMYDGAQYILAFPSDHKVLRVYFFDSPQGQIKVPVTDLMPTGVTHIIRTSARLLLGSDAAVGQLWEMYKSGVLTDNLTAIAWSVKSGSLGCGLDLFVKRFKRLFVVFKAGESYTVSVNVTVDAQAPVPSTITSSSGGVYDTALYDSAIYPRETAVVKNRTVGKKGRYAVVEFTNSSATERPTLYGFTLDLIPARRPKGER